MNKLSHLRNSTNVIYFACWKVNKCKRHEKKNVCFVECKIPWCKCYLFAKPCCPRKQFLQSNKNSKCWKYEWTKWWCSQLPHYILHGSWWFLQPPDGSLLFPRVQFESCWLNDATFLLNMLLLQLTGEKLLQLLRPILYRHSWLCILFFSVQIRDVFYNCIAACWETGESILCVETEKRKSAGHICYWKFDE